MAAKVEEFCRRKVSGQIILNVKDGVILGGECRDLWHVPKPPDTSITVRSFAPSVCGVTARRLTPEAVSR